jgi:1,4-dihydroxy-2-naphthoate octaprenyltransferase
VLLGCTLGSCLCLQIATNFFNDALDALQGKDTADRLGPRRITAAGASSASSTLKAGSLMLVLAIALSLPLIQARGWPIVWIGLPSLYFCYGYTGGPYPLAYRGLGEGFVILFFGLVAVTGSAFVQSGNWYWDAMVAGLQIGLLSTALIAINNLRDRAEDRVTGKNTLAVRLGERFARWEIVALLMLPHGIGLHWWQQQIDRAFTLPALLLPVSLWLAWSIYRTPPGRIYNRYLALSGLHLLLFALLFCLGLASSPP